MSDSGFDLGLDDPARAGVFFVTADDIATLDMATRDAGLLVHLGGYRCVQAGVVNMFPHTAHVESIAVFERD